VFGVGSICSNMRAAAPHITSISKQLRETPSTSALHDLHIYPYLLHIDSISNPAWGGANFGLSCLGARQSSRISRLALGDPVISWLGARSAVDPGHSLHSFDTPGHCNSCDALYIGTLASAF
jgi:hypothetical protein